MTLTTKRSLLKLAGWSTLAATAALVGCGKKEEPAPAAPAPAPASAPASAAAAPAPAKLKVAFAYVGPVGDGGWTFAHDNARKALEKELGDKIETSFVENVPEAADAERVFRDMVGQGAKLIFGTTFGYMEPMLKVAPEAKDVKFEHATGYKTADNMRTYDSRTYEGAYMAGVIAGKMTKTNTIGVVGSIPIPEVIRNINAFTLGAQSTNPKIKTKVVWVNEWFAPPKETEAATSLINGGADVLMQNTDSSAVLQTAEKLGKRAFGWDSDMKAYAPKAHLGSAVINWAPYYIQATKEALIHAKWGSDTQRLSAKLNGLGNVGGYFPQYRALNESHCTTIVDFKNGDVIITRSNSHIAMIYESGGSWYIVQALSSEYGLTKDSSFQPGDWDRFRLPTGYLVPRHD